MLTNDNHHIWIIDSSPEEKFLRRKTAPVSFSPKGLLVLGEKTLAARDTNALVAHMKKMMKAANGIGLSANQIGLPYQIFVAQTHTAQGGHRFYAIFNPIIEKKGSETVVLEEGCLSVPGAYGRVSRADQVVIRGLDKTGKPLKIKAWGLLARIFQHEIDHLNGMLFIDRTKEVYHAEPA